MISGKRYFTRESLDFSPFGFTAKADISGVDLKVYGLFMVICVKKERPR